MTNLTDTQQRLLDAVREAREQVEPSLTKLEEDYLLADYRAKAPVRDAVRAAEKGRVPYKRIAEEGMNFSYPGKLRTWMEAPEVVVQRLLDADVVTAASEGFEEVLENIKTVTRDGFSGEFTVVYQNKKYHVPSFGPSTECWSSADPAVPQGVYDLIQAEFPTWVLLEGEE